MQLSISTLAKYNHVRVSHLMEQVLMRIDTLLKAKAPHNSFNAKSEITSLLWEQHRFGFPQCIDSIFLSQINQDSYDQSLSTLPYAKDRIVMDAIPQVAE